MNTFIFSLDAEISHDFSIWQGDLNYFIVRIKQCRKISYWHRKYELINNVKLIY